MRLPVEHKKHISVLLVPEDCNRPNDVVALLGLARRHSASPQYLVYGQTGLNSVLTARVETSDLATYGIEESGAAVIPPTYTIEPATKAARCPWTCPIAAQAESLGYTGIADPAGT